MAKATNSDILAAINGLASNEFTVSGAALMKPLNTALKEAGFDEILAADRDAAMAEGLSNAPIEEVNLTLLAAPANPLPVYVHGIGKFEIRVGETKLLPKEVVEALEAAQGVAIKIEEE